MSKNGYTYVCHAHIQYSNFSYYIIYSVSQKTKTKQNPNIYPALVTKNEFVVIWNGNNKLPNVA